MSRLKSVILVTSPKKRSRRTERSRNLRRNRRRSPPRRRERSPRRSRPSRRRIRAPSRDTQPRRSETPRRYTPQRSPSPPPISPLTSSSEEDEDVIPTSPLRSPPHEEPKEARAPPPPPPKRCKEQASLRITRHDVHEDQQDEDETPAIVANYLRLENRRKRRAERKANQRRKKIRSKILEDARGNDVRLIQHDSDSVLETRCRVAKLLTLIRHHAIRRRIHSKQFWASEKSKPLRILMAKLSTGPYMCLFLNYITSMKQSCEMKKKNQQRK